LSFTKEQFPSLHRFSLEQYYGLGELGLLDRRTELLDGVIIDMEPVSPGMPISAIFFPAFSMKVPAVDSGCVSSIRSTWAK
jgi:hypothetical protein